MKPVSIVTGASGGIGRWIARGLAQAGHHVVLLGRNAARCRAAQDWIAAAVPGCALEIELADLSLLAETREAARAIVARHSAIEVLVNNAGVFTDRREQTAEGHERVIAVNHLAPFVLTRALMPALRASGRGRIINIGSSASDRARIDPDDLEGHRRWGLVHTYGQSKLALMMATFHLAHVSRGTGVVANLVHPGLVATGLVRAGGPIGVVWRALGALALDASRGADSPLLLALDPDFGSISGAYVKRRRVVRPNPLALDRALRLAVWSATERLVE